MSEERARQAPAWGTVILVQASGQNPYDIRASMIAGVQSRRGISVRVPLHELGRSGLVQSLTVESSEGRVAAALRYGQVLTRCIRNSLSDATALSTSAAGRSTLLLITGPSSTHQVLWEAVDTAAIVGSGANVLVVHLPGDVPDLDGVVAELNHTEGSPGAIRWVGARPLERDLPRYLVAGPVARHVAAANGLSFETLRTDATVEEAVQILSRQASPGLITHLDVHGTASMQASEIEGVLAESQFNAAFRSADGPVSLSEHDILQMVGLARPDFVVTNACFGGQQRNVEDWSMPAKLVLTGCDASLAARNPLRGDAASAFFSRFYAELALGIPIGHATLRARDSLAKFAASLSNAPISDFAATFAMQPVLWASSVAALQRRFLASDFNHVEERFTPLESVDAETWGDYLEIAQLGRGFGSFVSQVEDNHWAGTSFRIRRGQHADVTLPSLTRLVEGLLSSFGSGTTQRGIGATQGFEIKLHPFDDLERAFATATEFSTSSDPLCEVLSVSVPADVLLLRTLASSSNRDAAVALLDALAWGTPGDVTGDPSEPIRMLEATLAEECAQLVAAHHGPNELIKVIRDAHRLALGLPISAVRFSFAGFKAPSFLSLIASFPRSVVASDLGSVRRVGGESAIEPRPSEQVSMRRRMTALDVGRAFYWLEGVVENRPYRTTSARWSSDAAKICAAWLSLAIAHRQVGVISVTAVSAALSALSLVDRVAGQQMVDVLKLGRPGWVELIPTMSQAYDDVARDVLGPTGMDRVKLTSEAISTADRALGLLHSDRAGDALQLTSEEMGSASSDAGLLIAHAYALARMGNLTQALQVGVSLLAAFSDYTLWYRCEILHLMGDLMHRDERDGAAVEYFQRERDARPPALHRRLHNRAHLLTVLLSQDNDIDMIAVVAAEGLALSVAVEPSSAELPRFVDELLDHASLLSLNRRAPVIAALTTSNVDHPAVTGVLVALKTLPEAELPHSDEELLTALMQYGERATAYSALRLAHVAGLEPTERLHLLKRSASISCHVGAIARDLLIEATWEAEAWPDLQSLANEALRARPMSGFLHAAVAASLLQSGDPAEATQRMSVAMIHDSLFEMLAESPSLRKFAMSNEGFLNQAHQQTMELLLRQAESLESGANVDLATVPGVSLTRVVDRIFDYNEHLDRIDPRVAETLHDISESAWNRGDLASAAYVKRRTCELLELIGDQSALADELGWLATLEKQLGHVDEALSLYQRSIGIARENLSPLEEGRLVGRYANLLHEIGDFAAAARLQWLAVRIARGESSAASDTFPPTAERLVRTVEPASLSLHVLRHWPLLLVNLANCLEQADLRVLTSETLDRLKETFVELEIRDAKPLGAEAPQIIRLANRIRARLASGGSQAT